MRVDAIYGAIGRFGVRFRWLVLLIWIAAAIGASTQLPALSSVTQGNNQKFLPANAPSSQAAALAAPFGTANKQPIPVVAGYHQRVPHRRGHRRDQRAAGQDGQVPGITKVIDDGRSSDGQAEELVALASVAGSGNPNYARTSSTRCARRSPPRTCRPACRRTWPGDLAIQVDQQKASGNTGNKVQALSALFRHRAARADLPVVHARDHDGAAGAALGAIAGPLVAEAAKHGLQVSPIAQLLLIVLVIGAGTDYGLFLVFRVREELRAADHDTAGDNFPGASSSAAAVSSATWRIPGRRPAKPS